MLCAVTQPHGIPVLVDVLRPFHKRRGGGVLVGIRGDSGEWSERFVDSFHKAQFIESNIINWVGSCIINLLLPPTLCLSPQLLPRGLLDILYIIR